MFSNLFKHGLHPVIPLIFILFVATSYFMMGKDIAERKCVETNKVTIQE